MDKFWDILQWVLASGGGLAALFSFFLNKKINKQQHRLNKLKAKFDYLIIERNKVIAELNRCIADIELWMKQTSQCDDANQIKIAGFENPYRNWKYISHTVVICCRQKSMMPRMTCLPSVSSALGSTINRWRRLVMTRIRHPRMQYSPRLFSSRKSNR